MTGLVGASGLEAAAALAKQRCISSLRSKVTRMETLNGKPGKPVVECGAQHDHLPVL
jgi:hypothetical protein